MKNNQNNGTLKTETNYVKKPDKIGQLLKKLAAELGYSNKYVAKKLNMHFRSVYKLYNSNPKSINRLMQLSEVFNYNLLNEYHPNVKPAPNRLQQELDEAKEQLAELDLLKRENAALKTKNIQLEAENEAYLKSISAMNGRKG